MFLSACLGLPVCVCVCTFLHRHVWNVLSTFFVLTDLGSAITKPRIVMNLLFIVLCLSTDDIQCVFSSWAPFLWRTRQRKWSILNGDVGTYFCRIPLKFLYLLYRPLSCHICKSDTDVTKASIQIPDDCMKALLHEKTHPSLTCFPKASSKSEHYSSRDTRHTTEEMWWVQIFEFPACLLY